MLYDCIVIGGGIAGLQASIQLGRYQHKVLVIDANDGRSTLCRSYHNILGWPDGVSGQELRDTGKRQAQQLGVNFLTGRVEKAEKGKNEFLLTLENEAQYSTKRLLIATGVMDRIPPFPNLYPCLGISVYICPDCDGYEVKNRPVIVMGSGKPGANMALELTYWTKDIICINHEKAPIDQQLLTKLIEKKTTYIEEKIEEVIADGSNLQGFQLENGNVVKGDRAFIAFGGNEVKSTLAKQLGVELLENKHILVDPRSKMTSIQHVWAAGDVVAHSEQVTIAMGEGLQAAIWIHKSLMKE